MAQMFSIHPRNPQSRLLKQAAHILDLGGIGAIPTDSSYALVCHLDDKQAVDRIRQLRRLDERHLHDFRRVFDHPLSFLSSGDVETVMSHASRRRFTQLDPLPKDAKLIGVFGFLNDYKGFGTVVRALHHLPDDYHLLIFGGVHPNEIAARTAVHPYVASLLDA